ncbi:MAG: S-layer homology domain-containing protein [Chloroflexia bacterium]
MTAKKGMQISAALLALIILLVGLAAMNVSASYPTGNSASKGTVANQAESSIDWKADEAKARSGQPIVRQAVRAGVSLPLREIQPKITQGVQPEENENPIVHRGDPGRPQPPNFVDAARQSLIGPLVMPTPIVNFEGMYNHNGFIPPDTNGDIGRNQYVQTVNSTLEVYSRTGTSLYGPLNINELWAGVGGLCYDLNAGDPVVLYDPMAGRWLISQFTGQSNPTHQCIAISTSEDATGAYYVYDFIVSPTTTAFEDYPHFGVWPDAYYMTTNEFGGPNFGGNYAFERDKMLRGDATAQMVYFGVLDGGFLPTDLDGDPPPAGSPNYFVNFPDNANLNLYKFHVDWAVPSNSTFTGPTTIPVTPFDFDLCTGAREQCIDQPDTTARLEAIADRLMFRMAYRNMGTHEALVLMHTVDGNGAGLAGERWYELRAPNGAVSVFQQGTYAPADGVHRWMGSIAMDRQGNIAMGFSASSTTVYPSVRYAGRLVTDPLGQFSQGEATLLAGTGSEDYPGTARWGDYSSMSVDPVDECTFWYTNEYFARTGPRNWRTRIGSFRFPGCTGGTATPVATATAPYASPTPPPATATPCAGAITATSSITNTDPIQINRVNRSHPPSSCLAPNSGSVNADGFNRHYKQHTYTNSTGSTQCVTIHVVNACGDNATGSAAYLNTFDPNNVATNYLGDYGAIGGPEYTYSVSLPAGQTVVVVVHEVSRNLGCDSYTITINPCVQGAASATPTAGTPTQTPIVTPTATPTTVCVGTTYQVFAGAGATMIPANNKIANECDDCVTLVGLPFPVSVYGVVTNTVNVGSNGMLNFGSDQQNIYTQNCVPVASNPPPFTRTLFLYYDDLRTDVMTPTHGIYTDVIGTAPNRQFIIRWQVTYFDTEVTGDANFEAVLTEGSDTLRVIYGETDPGGDPGMGIQLNLGQYTSYACHVDPAEGDTALYVPIGCGITPTATPVLATSTPTPGICVMKFTDVNPEDWFYGYVEWLYCRGVVSGYNTTPPCEAGQIPCFKPENPTTRGQMAKIVVRAFNFPIDTTGGPHFSDVPVGSTFYNYVETGYNMGLFSGYADGTYRPNAWVTRGQLAKIVVNAAIIADPANWTLENPPTNTFQDVPVGSVFFRYIETAVMHNLVSGYPCGAPPAGQCVPPDNKPYFLPGQNASRAQISKIIYLAVSYPPRK